MNVFARNITVNLLRFNRIGLVQATARSFSASALDAKEVEKLVNKNKVVVFMKGNPEAPRCGFSNAVVQILRMHSVNYDSHDVLLSDELRQGNTSYKPLVIPVLLMLFSRFLQE